MTGCPVHVGLVGGGGITATHARAALAIPGVRIAAIHGVNDAKVRDLCAEYGGIPYDDFDAFLAHRPMEAVVIGSPSGLHAAQGIAAASRGLHVLVEKPIDITAERADALIRAAEASGMRLGVFFQDRFKPDLLELKRLLQDDGLGRVLIVDARVPWYRPPEYYHSSRWRGTLALDGGGALINQGIHTLDLLVWLLGDVCRVHARTATLRHRIEAEDSGAAILEFASGALGTFTFTTAAFPGYPRRISISGERGTAVVEQDQLVALDLAGGGPPGAPVSAPGPPDERASSPLVSDVGPHRAVLEDFLEAIREGRAPRCDGREARRSIVLVEAIYESSRTGLAVDLGAAGARPEARA